MIGKGKYLGKIIDCGLLKNSKGDPMAVIMFEVRDHDGTTKNMTWFGSFNGKAREFTVDALVRCGFESNKLADLNNGKVVLNCEIDFELVIDMQPNPKKDNALEPRIQWINLPGGSGFSEKMNQSDAVQLCAGLDLGADFMAARQKLGKRAAPVASKAEDDATIEDAPF